MLVKGASLTYSYCASRVYFPNTKPLHYRKAVLASAIQSQCSEWKWNCSILFIYLSESCKQRCDVLIAAPWTSWGLWCKNFYFADDLLESILVLADEYLISRLKRDCEEFMISRIKCNCVQSRVSKTSDSDLLLQYLYLGQTYGLQKITAKTEKQLGGRRHTDLLGLPNYHLPKLENVLRIRVKSLERQQKI